MLGATACTCVSLCPVWSLRLSGERGKHEAETLMAMRIFCYLFQGPTGRKQPGKLSKNHGPLWKQTVMLKGRLWRRWENGEGSLIITKYKSVWWQGTYQAGPLSPGPRGTRAPETLLTTPTVGIFRPLKHKAVQEETQTELTTCSFGGRQAHETEIKRSIQGSATPAPTSLLLITEAELESKKEHARLSHPNPTIFRWENSSVEWVSDFPKVTKETGSLADTEPALLTPSPGPSPHLWTSPRPRCVNSPKSELHKTHCCAHSRQRV